MATAWSNWSGFVTACPKLIAAPADAGELAELVRSAPGPLRVAGAGHSFTPLVQSDGTIVSLEKIEGLVSHDAANNRARVRAGTRLGALMHILQDIGQGLPNMGDIDRQAIGGALGTATHGSGPTLGAYHTQLEALQLIDGQGELREFSRADDLDMIHATGVALGAFGVLTEVAMNNIATYRLRRRKWVLPIGDMLKNFEMMMAAHRSAEFYYIPFSGYAQFIASDLSDAAPTMRPTEDDEEGLATLRKLRTALHWLPRLRRALIRGAVRKVPAEDYVQDWLNVYASERRTKFNEMEYHLPYEEGPKALAEIIALTEKHFPEVYFPIEVRSVAADEFWLSPFYKRLTCSIAIHHDAANDPLPFMRAAEPIFRKYGGRPHWGKMHSLKAADFKKLYPRWDDAMAVRRDIDPQNRFVSPYMAGLFGIQQ
ncbi:FAD-binding protein [Mesorhizobium sp. CA18]|uniref:D-arabinono-1,4-lactone oxidase n=1 Tax=unclassified Mesorhizobium TaxID=325217 RepID=UPI001CCFD5BA|nr:MULTISPECIES: D-arabinono-1,4-lactone oxidase [unclassified Mesorhizobium]MBZ9736174.1 FAD-binding protein [Mesorhizobium sp. CA9]MBZ9827938.1 FAD-binding protein [Mesorhizobium sp. CA18]MBZ9833744.1 FAD-binding protein [Mesorhizobium sp. CA2]MBZ9839957.1 FAD-binding protein [Mesorhizobium sp. CA3]MBZ9879909.1 FAD-binding protein [Mesorhizobium sp. Ca11]